MNLIKRILYWLISVAPMWALLCYVNTSINLVQNSIILCHSWYAFMVVSYSVAGFSDSATNWETTNYSLLRSHQFGLSSFTSIRVKTSFKIALFCAIIVNIIVLFLLFSGFSDSANYLKWRDCIVITVSTKTGVCTNFNIKKKREIRAGHLSHVPGLRTCHPVKISNFEAHADMKITSPKW